MVLPSNAVNIMGRTCIKEILRRTATASKLLLTIRKRQTKILGHIIKKIRFGKLNTQRRK